LHISPPETGFSPQRRISDTCVSFAAASLEFGSQSVQIIALVRLCGADELKWPSRELEIYTGVLKHKQTNTNAKEPVKV